MMEQHEITADDLRRVARFLRETVLDPLSDFDDIDFPLVIGDGRRFPQPSSEDRAAEQGLEVLRMFMEQAVAALFALAAIFDRSPDDIPLPPDIRTALLVPVQRYIDAFRASVGGSQSEPGRERS